MLPLPLPRPRPVIALAVTLLAMLAFMALAADLRWHGPVTRADPAISGWLHGRMQPRLTGFMVIVSVISSTAGVMATALLAAAWLVWRRARHWLPLLAATVGGGLLLNVALKHAFARARPLFDGLPVSDITSFSFPSGHTAGATVWWGFFVMLVFACDRRPQWRLAAIALASSMVLLTALSRVYLGFHYLSDVLAAMAEGVAWLALCVAVRRSPPG